MTVEKKNRLANAIQKIGKGWASAITAQSQKAEIFQVGKRNIKNQKMIDNWGNAKAALPLDFYAYRFSIHLIAFTSVTLPKYL